jgi:hypothetical protein
MLARSKFIVLKTMELGQYVSGLRVEDQRDARGMLGRVAKEYTNFRPIQPFVVGLLGLQFSLQNVDWGAEWVEMIEICFHDSTGKSGQRRLVIRVDGFPSSEFGASNKSSGHTVAQIGVIL